MEKCSTITDYIDAQTLETARALREVRESILGAAPHALELFNYGIPAFALLRGGRRDQQVMIAGYARHVGFYPGPEVLEHFDAELAGYRRGRGSIQFPNSQAIPALLIVRMVQWKAGLLRSEYFFIVGLDPGRGLLRIWRSFWR